MFVAAVLVPCAAWAQGGAPLGPEFRVNSYTTSNQLYPSVARDSGGNFVVVWTSNNQDGVGLGVFGQRFSAGGTPVGPEFRVNTTTAGSEYLPSVGMDNAGNFVVSWQNYQYPGTAEIFAQRFSNTGAPLGAEFRVNTYVPGVQAFSSVAVNVAGFVVVWHSYGQDGSSWGVFGQRFAPTGAPLGPEFRVNTYTTNGELAASISSDAPGNFVVVWQANGPDGAGLGVFGQRFGAAGVPLGGEFRVNSYTTNNQSYPAVITDGGGNFGVVWQSSGQDGSQTGVYGQRFSTAGAPLGGEFRVNSFTPGYQQLPDIAADATGNFVVAWTSDAQDGSAYGIFAQRYDNAGTPLGPEFRVNTYTSNSQNRAAVAADPLGNFVVTWDSQLQDGLGLGVFGQRFGPILPVELMDYGVE